MENHTVNEVLKSNEDYNKTPNNKTRSKLPSNALALYIKLYCKKKTSKSLKYSNNVIEATKSWIALCEKEKEQFYNKYKECEQKHIRSVGECLQKAEPYMKKKANKGYLKTQQAEVGGKNDEQELKTMITDENHLHVERANDKEYFNNTIENKTEINENYTFCNETDQTIIESNLEFNEIYPQEASNVFCLEPTPPNIKTGKELFEIMKQLDKENMSTWDTLPNIEKCHHNRAVLTLKQDYIVKYKQYLENLTKKELFDYYNKTFH